MESQFEQAEFFVMACEVGRLWKTLTRYYLWVVAFHIQYKRMSLRKWVKVQSFISTLIGLFVLNHS